MRRAGPDWVRRKIGPQIGLPQRKMQKTSPVAFLLRELRSICQQVSRAREKGLDGEESENIQEGECETGFSRRFQDLPEFAGALRASCLDLMT